MGWLGLVAMATVGRQSEEGGAQGMQSPLHPLQGWLAQEQGQTGNGGRTNSRCWGQFICLGHPQA